MKTWTTGYFVGYIGSVMAITGVGLYVARNLAGLERLIKFPIEPIQALGPETDQEYLERLQQNIAKIAKNEEEDPRYFEQYMRAEAQKRAGFGYISPRSPLFVTNEYLPLLDDFEFKDFLAGPEASYQEESDSSWIRVIKHAIRRLGMSHRNYDQARLAREISDLLRLAGVDAVRVTDDLAQWDTLLDPALYRASLQKRA